jgi:hypothetical protein
VAAAAGATSKAKQQNTVDTSRQEQAVQTAFPIMYFLVGILSIAVLAIALFLMQSNKSL